MSVRTDIVREALLGEFDPQAVRDGSTPDLTLYAPGIGADVKGRDAVADVLADFFAAAKPTYRLEIDPVEQGDVVVAFAAADIGGNTVHLCNVYRFEGDKIAGLWAIRV